MEQNEYERAWHDLKATIQEGAKNLADRSSGKIMLTSVLVQMELLQPSED